MGKSRKPRGLPSIPAQTAIFVLLILGLSVAVCIWMPHGLILAVIVIVLGVIGIFSARSAVKVCENCRAAKE